MVDRELQHKVTMAILIGLSAKGWPVISNAAFATAAEVIPLVREAERARCIAQIDYERQRELVKPIDDRDHISGLDIARAAIEGNTDETE